MKHSLPTLPYKMNALEPQISTETVEYHYGKHHAAYVKNLNAMIQHTDFEGQSLEDIIQKSEGGIFNNAAQVWNHTFYWNCLSPQGGGDPSGELAAAIRKNFGSFSEFKTKFINSAVTHFGSGWIWLVQSVEGLEILSTSNAESPLRTGKSPLLVCDVWEHAYYIDYRNARLAYLEAFWERVNWEFVAENYQ